MKTIAIRLKNGDDLKQSVIAASLAHKFKNTSVLTAVGSLRSATLRMAGARPGAENNKIFDGPLEIVSLVGTVDKNGSAHLHASLSDGEGTVVGGHVKDGCIVETTCEIVIGSSENTEFLRKLDEATGFDELNINEVNE
jgi:uncharacterized protein